MRPPSSQWILAKITSSPTSSYSTPASVSIPLQLYLRSSFIFHLCISASSWGPSKESFSLLYKFFLRPLFTYASPGWSSFLSDTDITKLERFHRAASRTISGCFLFSPIPLLLYEALFSSLCVTLTHFTLLFCERALRPPTSFPISGLARLGVKPRLCR